VKKSANPRRLLYVFIYNNKDKGMLDEMGASKVSADMIILQKLTSPSTSLMK
jgi:hypothetical protein